MDQVTIINSTLGKALGGASGTDGVVPWGPLIHMQGPGGVGGCLRVGGGGGELGPYRRGQHGLSSPGGHGVGSGTWPLTPTLTSALVLRGIHNRARAPGVPATAALPALPLLQQPATCCRWLCLQGPGPAHGEQRHCPVYGSQDPAVRSLAGVGQAGGGGEL